MDGGAQVEPIVPRADLDRWEEEAAEASGKMTTWKIRFLQTMTWLRSAEEALEASPEDA